VHLPADGTPLRGYELARADIEHGAYHRAGAEPTKRSFPASLSGSNKNGDSTAIRETDAVSRDASAGPAPAAAPAVVVTAGYHRGYGDGSCRTPYIPYGWTWHRASRC
jgi:hypothetical protein